MGDNESFACPLKKPPSLRPLTAIFRPFQGKAPAPELPKPPVQVEEHNPGPSEEPYTFKMASLNNMKRDVFCGTCCKIIFVILSIFTILKSIAVITVTIMAAIASKLFNTEQSGRLVAMVILAVTAAVTLAVVIYTVIAVCKKQRRPLHTASIALVIIAVLQGVIIGTSVKVTPDDQIILSRSLLESFKLAREHNPRHVKLWAVTQSDLTCCGIYGPEDYRTKNQPTYFPPDVSISCCPSYDPDRSELVQERERQQCKAKKEYYEIGCKSKVLQVLNETAILVSSVTVALILLEVLLAIVSAILYCMQRRNSKCVEENTLGIKT